MTPKFITTLPELVSVIRERRDEIELTHQTIDALAGFQDGYTSKLLAPTPMKNFGEMSLSAILGALALGVAVVIIDEDARLRALMEKRWTKRERPIRPPKHNRGAL